MHHSKVIEETKLWQVYLKNSEIDTERLNWMKTVYSMASEHLKAVRDTFDNYTLHDEKHVLNVLDAMAGVLGSRIDDLTIGETELLILAAALHDLGMIYTKQDAESCLSDKDRLQEYYSRYPRLRNIDVEDWNELDKQNYLRWLHPFRVGDVIHQSPWREQFIKCPSEVAPEDVIIAVCRAHGETPEKIRREVTEPRGELQYLNYADVDPLFCALLLRLADILDFDDSRAPSTLFSYAGKSEKSIEEWKKHASSMGFNYKNMPSTDELPYGAKFGDPNIERAANAFLDWIDEELLNSRALIPLANDRWKQFPFPYQVNRSEIGRVGYDYGDFKITMDQNRILDLLIGENLYSDRSVFVRELLQNSIDATLLREKMDPSFASKINTDEARIDIWEWWDENGDLWFRIDDCGCGMTRGMLEKYFLKAGNSYYNSQELKRDLNGKSYSSISRFGIGFLSCFLCGEEAYVSTTYWNREKNMREAENNGGVHAKGKAFGLRLDVVGVNGYFTLRNQSIADNRPQPLPAPPASVPHPNANYEKDGYRTLPGTSISIRLDAGKLGARNLREVAKGWACFPRMPIYYNGERLCLRRDELVELAKSECGRKCYDLTEEEKREYNSFLSKPVDEYPNILNTIELFEADHFPGLSKMKIFLCETRVRIPEDELLGKSGFLYGISDLSKLDRPGMSFLALDESNEYKSIAFQSKDDRKLFRMMTDYCSITSAVKYGWKGIFSRIDSHGGAYRGTLVIVMDEDEEGPDYSLNRDYANSISLKAAVTTVVWIEKNYSGISYSHYISDFSVVTLGAWKTLFSEEYLKWMDLESWDKFKHYKEEYEDVLNVIEENHDKYEYFEYEPGALSWRSRGEADVRLVFLAYLQQNYKIIVNYAKKKISFIKRDSDEDLSQFELLPLMPFSYGETEEDRSILCSSQSDERVVISADHPFTRWLLKNAEALKKYYPSLLDEILDVLREYKALIIINSVYRVIEQISKTAHRYGINVADCPKLTMDDFWVPETKELEES